MGKLVKEVQKKLPDFKVSGKLENKALTSILVFIREFLYDDVQLMFALNNVNDMSYSLKRIENQKFCRQWDTHSHSPYPYHCNNKHEGVIWRITWIVWNCFWKAQKQSSLEPASPRQPENDLEFNDYERSLQCRTHGIKFNNWG